MAFLVCQVGEKLPVGFERAFTMLNRRQTFWRLLLQHEKIDKPYSLDASDHFSVLPSQNDSCVKVIGVTRGPIEQAGKIGIVDQFRHRALISEYEWKGLRKADQPEAFWALALITTCFRLAVNSCNTQDCVGFECHMIDDLSSILRKLSICKTCKKRMMDEHKYEFSQFLELIGNLNKDKTYDADTSFVMPSLPVLQRQIRGQKRLGNKRFDGYGLVILMHFLEDLVPFVEGLIDLGAKKASMVLIVKPYPYAQRLSVHSYFHDNHQEIRVEYLTTLPPSDALLKDVVEYSRSRSDLGKILVIEDGGYLVPFLNNNFTEADNFCVGAVEQTTKGIKKDQQIKETKRKLLFPVMNVAKSTFKDEYEAPLVGSSIAHNVQKLSERNLAGVHALVIGFGSVGRQVAAALAAKQMIVKVYDLVKTQRAAAAVRGFRTSSNPVELVRGTDLIVGATGNFDSSAIGKEILEEVEDGTILVSASSDRFEIDLSHLERMANSQEYKDGLGTWYTIESHGSKKKKYLLLADGFPVNFYSGSGIPTEAIDPILTQLFVGAVHLAAEHVRLEPDILNIMNQINELYQVEDDFLAVMRW